MNQKQIEQLVSAYDNYVKLLCQEIEDMSPIAIVHGFESKLVQQGIDARKALNEALSNLNMEPKYTNHDQQ